VHVAVCVCDAESPLMRDEKQPLGGAVVVTVDSGTVGRLDVEVLWAHTTDSMCLAYMSTADQQAKVPDSVILRVAIYLEKPQIVGELESNRGNLAKMCSCGWYR